jgi:hypothetical protein
MFMYQVRIKEMIQKTVFYEELEHPKRDEVTGVWRKLHNEQLLVL